MKRKKRKRFDLTDPKQREEYEDQLTLRLMYLRIQEAEYERRLRKKAIQLSRKNKRQANGWII